MTRNTVLYTNQISNGSLEFCQSVNSSNLAKYFSCGVGGIEICVRIHGLFTFVCCFAPCCLLLSARAKSRSTWSNLCVLFSLTRITPILADSAFHLFIQSSLTVKEMENFISGRDKRDLIEIIDPECRRNKDRRCTCHSTVDSGFSGSVQPDDFEESRGISDGKLPACYTVCYEL